MSHIYTNVSKKKYKTIRRESYSFHGERTKLVKYGAMKGKPLVVPIDILTLTKLEKIAALDTVNIIKEKRNGDIKGRTCANGAKQHRYVKAGEIT